MFRATLAEKLNVVRGEDVNVTMEWLRAKLSFEVLRSTLLCVSGSKKAWYQASQPTLKTLRTLNCDILNKNLFASASFLA